MCNPRLTLATVIAIATAVNSCCDDFKIFDLIQQWRILNIIRSVIKQTVKHKRMRANNWWSKRYQDRINAKAIIISRSRSTSI